MSQDMVYVSHGAGTPPMKTLLQPSDTVSSILKRLDIHLRYDETAVIGNRRVVDPETTQVFPNEFITIAGKPGNG